MVLTCGAGAAARFATRLRYFALRTLQQPVRLGGTRSFTCVSVHQGQDDENCKPQLKVAALLGTTRPGSYTQKALTVAVDELVENHGVQVTLIDPAAMKLGAPGTSIGVRVEHPQSVRDRSEWQ